MLLNSKSDVFRESNVTASLPILENVDAISFRHRGNWLRGLDLNQRPSGYEPDELPGCSTPRDHYGEMMRGSNLKAGLEADNPIGESVSCAANSRQRRYYFFNKFHNIGIEGSAK
jgi:hypothetical protein